MFDMFCILIILGTGKESFSTNVLREHVSVTFCALSNNAVSWSCVRVYSLLFHYFLGFLSFYAQSVKTFFLEKELQNESAT